MSESQHMHGIFGVVPKLLNQLDAVYVTLATLSD